jgi:hypothetical protein
LITNYPSGSLLTRVPEQIFSALCSFLYPLHCMQLSKNIRPAKRGEN